MKIELNKAGLKELVRLKGIGQAKARRIIAHRQERGCFKKAEELIKVKGIGKRIFSRIKDSVKIEDLVEVTFDPSDYGFEDISEVHLVGEMTDWDPSDKSYSLQKNENGEWKGIFSLDPGMEYKFMCDGDSWETGRDVGGLNGENLVI